MGQPVSTILAWIAVGACARSEVVAFPTLDASQSVVLVGWRSDGGIECSEMPEGERVYAEARAFDGAKFELPLVADRTVVYLLGFQAALTELDLAEGSISTSYCPPLEPNKIFCASIGSDSSFTWTEIRASAPTILGSIGCEETPLCSKRHAAGPKVLLDIGDVYSAAPWDADSIVAVTAQLEAFEIDRSLGATPLDLGRPRRVARYQDDVWIGSFDGITRVRPPGVAVVERHDLDLSWLLAMDVSREMVALVLAETMTTTATIVRFDGAGFSYDRVSLSGGISEVATDVEVLEDGTVLAVFGTPEVVRVRDSIVEVIPFQPDDEGATAAEIEAIGGRILIGDSYHRLVVTSTSLDSFDAFQLSPPDSEEIHAIAGLPDGSVIVSGNGGWISKVLLDEREVCSMLDFHMAHDVEFIVPRGNDFFAGGPITGETGVQYFEAR